MSWVALHDRCPYDVIAISCLFGGIWWIAMLWSNCTCYLYDAIVTMFALFFFFLSSVKTYCAGGFLHALQFMCLLWLSLCTNLQQWASVWQWVLTSLYSEKNMPRGWCVVATKDKTTVSLSHFIYFLLLKSILYCLQLNS